MTLDEYHVYFKVLREDRHTMTFPKYGIDVLELFDQMLSEIKSLKDEVSRLKPKGKRVHST